MTTDGGNEKAREVEPGVSARCVRRRSVIKASIAAGGGIIAGAGTAAAATNAAWAPPVGGNPLIERLVPTATHWGMIEARVQGGRFVEASAFSGDANPTPMIQAFPDRVYSESRIRGPAVRRSFLEHGAKVGGKARGEEEFVPVSWDEATSLVASELERVRTAHGNESIFPGSADWQSAGLLHSASALVRRMLGGYGGFTDCTGDPSVAAAMVIMPHVVGDLEVYDEQTAWPVIQEHTDLLVLLGADILKDNQIGTHPTDHYAYAALEAFRGKVAAGKARVVAIDPRMTDTAKYLGATWLAPRPNTDTALMLGLAFVLHSEHLADRPFLARYTVGFDKFADYLTGKADGQAKTPEWAAGITGIDAGRIRTLARDLVHHRTMLISGFAIQRADHGEQPYWMLVTLAAMLGQIGLPGGGYGVSYHYDDGGNLVARAPLIPGISAGENPVKTALPFARVTEMFLNPGKTVAYNGTTFTYPDIRLVYWAGGNPLTHLWQTNRVRSAWQRPETIIVQDPFWTPSAKFADIVLPATTTFERNDIEVSGAYSRRYIAAMKQVVAPIYGSRNDFDILADIAGKLGFRAQFSGGKSEMDWLRSFYAVAEKQATMMKIAMPDFETFWHLGYAEFPIPPSGAHYVRHAAFREDPVTNALGTPSGRIEIYSKTIESYHYADCPPHPTWLEPVEWLGSPQAKAFPFHVVSPHPRYRLHSQLDNTWIREWYEVQEREPVWINDEDARDRGIANGDVVRVFNERGELLAGALTTPRVRRGVLVIQEGCWYDPGAVGKAGPICKHGLINVLTLDKGTSRLAQGNIANTVLADIEKFSGELPEVTAFRAPLAQGAD